MSVDGCPDRDALREFKAGSLSDEKRDEIAAHVNRCASCISLVQTLADTPAGVETASAELEVTKGLSQNLPPTLDYIASCSPPELRVLGDYRLEEKLGQGGMGAVYRAVHMRLGKTVAVKILPPERLHDARAVARFRREMEAVGRLTNRNIVQAHDAREEQGVHLLVMEYLLGMDLSRLVRRHGRLDVADACEAIRQAASGLDYAHKECGLVHRDLKPSNLMLTPEGCIKVLDLGLARLSRMQVMAQQESPADVTTGEQTMGTIDYMAPEQWLDAHNVDSRADVYSLGCTLYDLLTGTPPFSGPDFNTLGKKMLAHSQAQVPEIRTRRPDVPDGLATVLRCMMAKDPKDRFASLHEAAVAMAPFAKGHCLSALLGPGAAAGSVGEDANLVRSNIDQDLNPGSPAVAPVATCQPSRSRDLRSRRLWRMRPALAGLLSLCLLGFMVGGVLFMQSMTHDRLHQKVELLHQKVESLTDDGDTVRPALALNMELHLRHFRQPKKENGLILLGEIGDAGSKPEGGDWLVVEATFGERVYPYLVSVDPKGNAELTYPDEKAAAHEMLARFVYPPKSGNYLELDAGLNCVAVLAARKPLRPFTQWKPSIDNKAWREANVTWAWAFDGVRCDPLDKARSGVVESSQRLTVFEELCLKLKSKTDVAALRARAFPVAPKR